MAILIPAVIKSGYFPRLTLKLNTPDIRQVLKAMLPSLLGLGVIQITVIINTRFASELPEGTVSWLYVADRILELPLSLFAVSMGTALLPTLSQYWAQNQVEKMVEVTNRHIRLVLFLALPSAIGAFILAHPIIEVIFQRLKFSAYDTQNTAAILQVYGLAILTYSGVRVLAPAFYAIKNTWYPALVSAVALVLHIFIAAKLITIWGAVGLAASTVTTAGINLALLVLGYFHFIGRLDLKALFASLFKFSVAGVTMALFLNLHPLLVAKLEPGTFGKILLLAFSVGGGALVYLTASTLLKTEETTEVLSRLKRRFG
jgi:putative peptidoglycan lipid II flippase